MSLRFKGSLESATDSRLVRAIRTVGLLLLTVSATDLTADVEDAERWLSEFQPSTLTQAQQLDELN
ncbi:MAG: hypothetical protein QGG54_04160, partial [Gammaproteobacteria bacterium]|nr:hypothetical protein [Gammaproteobacteria bacterium]